MAIFKTMTIIRKKAIRIVDTDKTGENDENGKNNRNLETNLI